MSDSNHLENKLWNYRNILRSDGLSYMAIYDIT